MSRAGSPGAGGTFGAEMLTPDGNSGPTPDDGVLARLVDIAAHAGPRAAMATALRTRSRTYRDVLTRLATGRPSYAELETSGESEWYDPEWLAALGRIIALQGLDPQDQRSAADLLELAAPSLDRKTAAWVNVLLTQLYITNEDFERAALHLASHPELHAIEWGYLRTDLVNPHTASPFADADEWWRRFAALFTSQGYAAPRFIDGDGPPFDRVEGPVLPRIHDGPLISVIMTTFKPEERDLLSSINSILQQSWRNLELVLIDDHSPESYRELLEHVAQLDPRIRYFRLPENGGTYLARNAGIRRSRGVFVTGQDADDWSHPARLEVQVRPLIEGTAGGTRVRSVTTDDRLVATRPGFTATRANPSTLMVRRDDAVRLGGFLPARKAADSEFHFRVERSLGRPVVTIGEGPLTIVRVRQGSLSRTDFLPGWAHPARRAFVNQYRHWHATSNPNDLRVDKRGEQTPIALPHKFNVVATSFPDIDVLWVGDYRERLPYAGRLVAELRHLTSRGRRVGLLHLEDPRFPARRKEAIHPDVLSMINDKELTQVLEDDDLVAEIAVIRRPWLLAAPPSRFALRARHLVVCGAGRLSDSQLSDLRRTAKDLFTVVPRWSGETIELHQGLQLRGHPVTPHALPDVIETTHPRAARQPTTAPPLIGRELPDEHGRWATGEEDITDAYPVNGKADVRFIRSSASASTPALALERHWTIYPPGALSLPEFLDTIEYYVVTEMPLPDIDFTHALEAMARGCVVVLPEGVATDLGRAVARAPRGEVSSTIATLHRSPALRTELSRNAINYIAREHTAAVLEAGLISALGVASGARPVG